MEKTFWDVKIGHRVEPFSDDEIMAKAAAAIIDPEAVFGGWSLLAWLEGYSGEAAPQPPYGSHVEQRAFSRPHSRRFIVISTDEFFAAARRLYDAAAAAEGRKR